VWCRLSCRWRYVATILSLRTRLESMDCMVLIGGQGKAVRQAEPGQETQRQGQSMKAQLWRLQFILGRVEIII
jgi:hypothetical protein